MHEASVLVPQLEAVLAAIEAVATPSGFDPRVGVVVYQVQRRVKYALAKAVKLLNQGAPDAISTRATSNKEHITQISSTSRRALLARPSMVAEQEAAIVLEQLEPVLVALRAVTLPPAFCKLVVNAAEEAEQQNMQAMKLTEVIARMGTAPRTMGGRLALALKLTPSPPLSTAASLTSPCSTPKRTATLPSYPGGTKPALDNDRLFVMTAAARRAAHQPKISSPLSAWRVNRAPSGSRAGRPGYRRGKPLRTNLLKSIHARKPVVPITPPLTALITANRTPLVCAAHARPAWPRSERTLTARPTLAIRAGAAARRRRVRHPSFEYPTRTTLMSKECISDESFVQQLMHLVGDDDSLVNEHTLALDIVDNHGQGKHCAEENNSISLPSLSDPLASLASSAEHSARDTSAASTPPVSPERAAERPPAPSAWRLGAALWRRLVGGPTRPRPELWATSVEAIEEEIKGVLYHAA